MEKTPIYTDHDKVKKTVQDCETACVKIQNIYDEFAKAGYELSLDEIMSLIKKNASEPDVRTMIVNKQAGQNPVIFAGVKISKKKLTEIIEIENITEICSSIHDGFSYIPFFKYLHIHERKVALLPGFEDRIKEDSTIYATTPKQKAKAEAITTAVDALNNLYQHVYRPDWLPEIRGLKVVGASGEQRYAIDPNELR